MKLNLKEEINKLKEHRKQYFPVLEYLLGLYNKRDTLSLPYTIENSQKIFIALELIDVGYVDKEAFIITQDRKSVTGFHFSGREPLTEKGFKILKDHLESKRGFWNKLKRLF